MRKQLLQAVHLLECLHGRPASTKASREFFAGDEALGNEISSVVVSLRYRMIRGRIDRAAAI